MLVPFGGMYFGPSLELEDAIVSVGNSLCKLVLVALLFRHPLHLELEMAYRAV